MAEASLSSSLRVPAPQRVGAAVVVALLLALVLASAPCGGAGRPVREGTSDGAATVARVRALDGGGDHLARDSVATATGAARRATTTVGGGAPTPPSGPSQNHN